MDYNIARDGQQLGVFSESQIRANLINGTCQPTDVAWCEGMTDWKPLSELFPAGMAATPPPAPQQFKTSSQFVVAPNSGLSIASLVCGILTLLTCIITGIPAIICGHMALSKIKKSGGAVGGKGMAIAGLVMGYLSLVFGIFVIASMASVGTAAYKRGADRAKSLINARQIVMACKNYALNHDGKYPNALEELLKEGDITDDKILHDPMLQDDTLIGYEYFGAGMKDSDPPDKVLLMSKSADSSGKKVVARNDGNVKVEAPPAQH